MQYSQSKPGRIFVIRLEHGDVIHENIERFAREQSIQCAALLILGGADEGSKLVVGPADGKTSPAVPMETILENVHEAAGTGTIFPDEKGNPVLHMHIACGRNRSTTTGCVRRGVKTWHVLEVICIELAGSSGVRMHDPETGFSLLRP